LQGFYEETEDTNTRPGEDEKAQKSNYDYLIAIEDPGFFGTRRLFYAALHFDRL